MKEQWLLSAVCPPSLSNSLLLSPSPLIFLSFSPSHPRNADFRPQGLKSGWRGANYYGKENKTRRERGKRDRESGGREGDRCRGGWGEEQHWCSLAEERRKNKETNREVKSSFPIVHMCFKVLVDSWCVSQHALGTRQENILGSDSPDLYVCLEKKIGCNDTFKNISCVINAIYKLWVMDVGDKSADLHSSKSWSSDLCRHANNSKHLEKDNAMG